jgi:hypothetical protein
VRRHWIVTFFAVVGAVLIAQGVLRVIPWPGSDGFSPTSAVVPGARDYHDQLQLSEAVTQHYGAKYGGCGKNPDGTYACVLVGTNGAGATYTITVSPDGKTWSAS